MITPVVRSTSTRPGRYPVARRGLSWTMTPVYLTLTSTAPAATDLGYLLHKHPDRAQPFDVSVGDGARVLPGGDRRALHRRAAARGRPDRAGARAGGRGGDAFALGAVRQRPAVRRVVDARGGAGQGLPHRDGRPLRRPARAGRPGRCRWRSRVPGAAVPRAAPSWSRELFEPLGWTVDGDARPAGREVPDWGDSPLRRPAADRRRCGSPTRCPTSTCCCPCSTTPSTTGSATDEVDKLLRAGGDWLAAHPERELITRRYLAHQRDLVAAAAGPAGRGRTTPSPRRSTTRSPSRADAAEPTTAGRCSAGGAVLAALRARRRRAGRRPRLRRGRAAARPAGRRRRSPRSLGVDVSARALELAERRLQPRPDARHASGRGCGCSSRR